MVTSIGGSELDDVSTVRQDVDGPWSSCTFHYPRGICIGSDNTLFLSMTGDYLIRKVDLQNKTVQHEAGSKLEYEGEEYLSFPRQLAYCRESDEILVADSENHRIARVKDGVVSTLVMSYKNRKPGYNGGNLKESSNDVEYNDVHTKDGFLVGSHVLPPTGSYATTCEPTDIQLSQDGTLFWIESFSRVRYIRNLAQPPTSKFPTFEHLRSTGLFSDLIITPKNSIRSLHLHNAILKLWNVDLMRLQAIESELALESFISFIYDYNGPDSTKSPSEIAEYLAYVAFVSKKIGLDSGVQIWTRRKFEQSTALLAFDELAPLLIRISHTCEYQRNLVEPLCRLLQRNPTQADEQLIGFYDSGLPQATELLVKSIIHGNESLYPSICLEPETQETPPWLFLQNALALLAAHLSMDRKDTNTSSSNPISLESASEIETDFDFKIPVDRASDQPDFHVLSAHSWLLYSRWSWFRALIDSGMDEMKAKTAVLPSDFPPDLFFSLIQFIYCTTLDYKKEHSLENCQYIASIGGLFRLVDLDDKPEPGFAPFVSHCLNTAKRILGPSTATQPKPDVQEPPEVLIESLSEDPAELWAPIS